MSEDYFRAIEPIFLEAMQLRGERRRAYLERACAGRAALRQEVESLLAADESTLGVALDEFAGLAAQPDLRTCRNGHRFDPALYTLCPRCGIDDLQLDAAPYGFVPPVQPLAELADEPLAGWLVCIEGPDRGRDYALRGATSTIGQTPAMTVCLANDRAVAHAPHAVVIYDSDTRAFHLVPGAYGKTYLNGAPLTRPTLLSVHDTIRVGHSQLRFVPFCGDFFRWH